MVGRQTLAPKPTCTDPSRQVGIQLEDEQVYGELGSAEVEPSPAGNVRRETIWSVEVLWINI